MAAIKRQEFDFKTAHDALTQETERRQAKVIWAMGLPDVKTAIGRAWAKHEALGSHSLTARVIPSTKTLSGAGAAVVRQQREKCRSGAGFAGKR